MATQEDQDEILEDQELEEEFDEAEEEKSRLSGKQRLWLIVSGVVSFFLFLVLLFPFEGILRNVVLKRLGPNLKVEFSAFKLGLIGQTKIDDLSVQSTSGFRLDAESAAADLQKLALLRFSPKGTVRLNGGNFTMGKFSGAFKSLDITMDMSRLDAPASQWEGTIQVKLDDLQPEQLPDLLSMLPVSGDDLSVQRVTIPLQFRKGTLDFGQSQLQSTLFSVRLEGNGHVGASVLNTSLDGKVCLKPVDDLETRNEGLHGVYMMAGGTAGGELCLKISGVLSSPSFTRLDQAPAL